MFIDRVGLRYINRIKLPLPIKSFEEYFKYVPPVPADLPKVLKRFFMQVEIPVAAGYVTLTETIEQIDEKTNTLPFLLDIDCVRPIDAVESDENLRSIFRGLRDQKNKIFEDCITDSARHLFD